MRSPSLKLSSFSFSASKSYSAWAQGPRSVGVRAGERTGEGSGEALVYQSIRSLLSVGRLRASARLVEEKIEKRTQVVSWKRRVNKEQGLVKD